MTKLLAKVRAQRQRLEELAVSEDPSAGWLRAEQRLLDSLWAEALSLGVLS